MNSLVVYFSRTGNTKKIAKKLSKELNAELEEITEPKNRMGALGFIKSGSEAMRKKIVPIHKPKHNPEKFDLIIVGTPIWAGRLSSPVRSYLSKYSGKLKRTAFFCTCTGLNPEKAFEEMQKLSKKPLATLLVREQELSTKKTQEKIKKFVKKLKTKN